jgi:hypothetical protein
VGKVFKISGSPVIPPIPQLDLDYDALTLSNLGKPENVSIPFLIEEREKKIKFRIQDRLNQLSQLPA